MRSLVSLVGIGLLACIFSCYSMCADSQSVPGGATVQLNVSVGRSAVANVEDDFVCATLDWWPPEKCDYGTCSWHRASLLNLDLSNKMLFNAIKAFSSLKIRLGGSLQDKVLYATDDLKQPCPQFTKDPKSMFGFTEGCLTMASAKVIFGLNALNGRTIQRPHGPAVGAWDSKNAESFIRYTVSKNYTILGWEFGNELSGSGVGTRVAASQYASDTLHLKNLVLDIYKSIEPKPLILAPGGSYDALWFKEYLDKTPKSLDAITLHIYNLGSGADQHLIEKILNPTYLDGIAKTFRKLQSTIKGSASATSAVAWVGEAGGAFKSGRDGVSNAFVYSFWYLDQMGIASTFDTKTYCRQSLIGGNYGLLDATSNNPNPDYYSALLWHRLMGRKVLGASFSGSNKIRVYAHCAKASKGVTLLMINLDGSSIFEVMVEGLKNSVSLPKGLNDANMREEYHLTPQDGNLHSQTLLLNGNILAVSPSGDIPALEPKYLNSTSSIVVGPHSIVFAHMPYHVIPACNG
ncbi:heparanase-like protein 3 isoform X2 [Rhodamnia argentea]|uniref:Heparanase-like protein 3 isoform X2 n=1 Tax=Rhodamnia argentea TaxID=178133 RepID=A0ABM3HC77_9MYRT|nr:heparanase-like protein 3 isoform X2 [Rhodamnia argentea]